MGSKNLVVDTDIIVDYLRGKEKILAIFIEKENLFISSISLFELVYGALKSKEANQIRNLKEFLSSFTIIGLGEREALKSAEIKYSLEKTGKSLDIRDIFIAAICQVNNLSLLTKNIKHFKRIKIRKDLKI